MLLDVDCEIGEMVGWRPASDGEVMARLQDWLGVLPVAVSVSTANTVSLKGLPVPSKLQLLSVAFRTAVTLCEVVVSRGKYWIVPDQLRHCSVGEKPLMCEPVLLAEAVAAVPRLMAATPATAAARTARRERAERID